MRAITARDVRAIQTPDCRDYAARIAQTAKDLHRVMQRSGVPIDRDAGRAARIESLKNRLREEGALFRNDGKSIVFGPLSPACERCRTGVRSVSLFLSLACNRNCWFCFNPNQHDYRTYRKDMNDWRGKLHAFAQSKGTPDVVALTGGEPLLFPDEAIAFFREAKKTAPAAHARLYTSGDGLDDALLDRLAKAGLDEIRFSVKLDDTPDEQERLWGRIEEACTRIPAVMIEMPVMPGTHDEMMRTIERLDAAGAFGINLLELCFPLHNAPAYRARGLSLVEQPYRIPYDYGYAGALPVAGSEELALALMLEAHLAGMTIGLHYCSLENKNTAQIYDQNRGGALDIPPYEFSHRTFFYEVVRAFDNDAAFVVDALSDAGIEAAVAEDGSMVAFPPSALTAIEGAVGDAKLFLASAVIEGTVFRDVGLQVLEPGDAERFAREGDSR